MGRTWITATAAADSLLLLLLLLSTLPEEIAMKVKMIGCFFFVVVAVVSRFPLLT